MDYLKVLGIKFVAISITVLSIYGIFQFATLTNLIVISLLTTVVSFLIGDLLILRKTGNLVASIADFVLAFATLWVLSTMFVSAGVPIAATSLLSAFFIACVEPFVHEYMLYNIPAYRHVLKKREPVDVQTEFAEEPDVHDIHNDYDDGEK